MTNGKCWCIRNQRRNGWLWRGGIAKSCSWIGGDGVCFGKKRHEDFLAKEVWSTGVEGEVEVLWKENKETVAELEKNMAEFQRRGLLRLLFCRRVRVHLKRRWGRIQCCCRKDQIGREYPFACRLTPQCTIGWSDGGSSIHQWLLRQPQTKSDNFLLLYSQW